MCSIIGWFGDKITREEKLHLLQHANERGRDGWGFEMDGIELRGFDDLDEVTNDRLAIADKVIGNFRATPTTEAESKKELLQPYDGIVHNGTIANDKKFGDYEIDSMVLPKIFEDRSFDSMIKNCSKIKGSYAIAYFHNDELLLACNYKPIYFIRKDDSFIFASSPDMLLGHSVPMKPYSVMKVNKENIVQKELPRKQYSGVLVAASSGLDSTTVAYKLKKDGYDVTLVNFLYGCLAEKKEVERVAKIANHSKFKLKFLDMPKVMKGTITEGTFHKSQIEAVEYAEDWVSARNLLMLSILTAYAETYKYGYIAFGGNLEESSAFPDNEQEFGRRFNAILPYATQNGIKIELLQPVAHLMKHEIVKLGNEVGAPWELTWSCYSNGDKHCGDCAPCFLRKTAFERNGLKDPVFL